MKKSKFLLFVAGIFTLWACDDILETDISDKQVILVSPADSLHAQKNKLTFSWNPVNGASGYVLQVVQPSFIEQEFVVLDTFLLQTQFTMELPAGKYAWGVAAVNSAYSSYFSTRYFSIDSVNSPSTLGISLLAPSAKQISKDTDITFEWEKAADVANYDLRIWGAWEFSAQTQENTLKLTIPQKSLNDTIHWQVFGVTSEQLVKYHSDKRWFLIDTTPPPAVTLLAPAADQVFKLNEEITFSWEESTAADFKEYEFTIYNTATDPPSVQVGPSRLTTPTTKLSGPEGSLQLGSYLWEIKTVDQLGNTSSEGMERRGFTVEE